MNITIKINSTSGNHILNAVLYDKKSANAFASLLKNDGITVKLSEYGGFEKVGALSQNLPRTDSQIETNSGDIMLYNGRQITIFYEPNRWSYSRLGKILGKSKDELKSILGNGDVEATFSLVE